MTSGFVPVNRGAKGTRTPENKVKMPAELQKHNGVITRTDAKLPGETPRVVEEINTVQREAP